MLQVLNELAAEDGSELTVGIWKQVCLDVEVAKLKSVALASFRVGSLGNLVTISSATFLVGVQKSAQRTSR
jgi:hypothetical protein